MSVYEVDRDADTLVILTKFDTPESKSSPPSILGKRLVNGAPNTAVNGHTPPSEVRIKVSSKHLNLASRYFRTNFGWGAHLDDTDPAGPPRAADGRIHVPLEGFDPAAVKIVLNIIHSRGFRVPKSLDLPALTRVAAFVDAFQAHEAVEAYGDRWIAPLAKSPVVANGSGSELARWIFISSVFRQYDLFREVTRTAITQSTGPISAQGLPIPDAIIKSIDSQRQILITKVLFALHEIVDELRGGYSACSQGCDAFLLGVLLQALHKWRLAKPYAGVSFKGLVQAVRGLQEQIWYARPLGPVALVAAGDGHGEKKTGSLKARFPEHYCGTRGLINPVLYSLEVSVVGLEAEREVGYY